MAERNPPAQEELDERYRELVKNPHIVKEEDFLNLSLSELMQQPVSLSSVKLFRVDHDDEVGEVVSEELEVDVDFKLALTEEEVSAIAQEVATEFALVTEDVIAELDLEQLGQIPIDQDTETYQRIRQANDWKLGIDSSEQDVSVGGGSVQGTTTEGQLAAFAPPSRQGHEDSDDLNLGIGNEIEVEDEDVDEADEQLPTEEEETVEDEGEVIDNDTLDANDDFLLIFGPFDTPVDSINVFDNDTSQDAIDFPGTTTISKINLKIINLDTFGPPIEVVVGEIFPDINGMIILDGNTDPALIELEDHTITLDTSTGMLTASHDLPFQSHGGDIIAEITYFARDFDDQFDAMALATVTMQGAGFGPVILDLNGDGLDLISADDSPIAIDPNSDGVANRIGWFGSSDGLLVYDHQGDNDVTELDEFVLTMHHEDAQTDLEGLRLAFDSNEDGYFDATDEEFSSFKIWQDANTNGIVDLDEMQTLSDRGIESLFLFTDEQAYLDEGNIVFGTGQYTLDSGETLDLYDVSLNISSPVNYEVNPDAPTQVLSLNLEDVIDSQDAITPESVTVEPVVQEIIPPVIHNSDLADMEIAAQAIESTNI